MSYYSQHFIDQKGESYFEKMCFELPYSHKNIDDLSFESVRNYYELQHYLTKCIVTGKSSKTCQQYVIQMYQDFYKQPWKFVHSPLLKDTIIEKVFGHNAFKIKQFRDSYYSEVTAKKIYKESKKRELTESEKNQLYSFFIRNLNTKNESLQRVIKQEIKKIIDSNKSVRRLSDSELLLYCQYIANTTPTKPIVMLGEVDGNKQTNGEEEHNIIVINHDIPGCSIASLTHIVFHECRHAVQEEESKNKDTVAAFEMAQYKLFNKYMNADNYDSYHDNYKYSSIELDAENHGYYDATIFLCGEFQREDLREELNNSRKFDLETRNYYAFMYDEKKRPISVDKFIVENMDKIIKEHPEEIKNYPVLSHFYHPNGSKKSFLEIFMQRINQSQNRRMYEYYLNYGIRNGELDKIDLKNMSSNDIRSLIPALVSTYRLDNVCTLKDYFMDTKTYKNSNHKEFTYKQIETTTNYKLFLATKLLSYINQNFDTIIEAYKGTNDERISNTHPVYNFLYDFRDFNPDNIENEVLRTSPSFRKKLEDYKAIYTETLKKFNKIYAIQRLEELPQTDRKTIVTINNKQLTIEDFILKYALLQMDSHQKICIGNNKYSLRETIYYLKSMEKNQELENMLTDPNEQNVENNRIIHS